MIPTHTDLPRSITGAVRISFAPRGKMRNSSASAFLDHIETLEQHLGFPVLGYVLAHEIGHLFC